MVLFGINQHFQSRDTVFFTTLKKAVFCILEISENTKVLLWANEDFQNKHTSLICFTNLTVPLLARFCMLEIEKIWISLYHLLWSYLRSYWGPINTFNARIQTEPYKSNVLYVRNSWKYENRSIQFYGVIMGQRTVCNPCNTTFSWVLYVTGRKNVKIPLSYFILLLRAN